MDTRTIIKKIYLDENLMPIIQLNKGGDIIYYSSNENCIRYELTYNYLAR